VGLAIYTGHLVLLDYRKLRRAYHEVRMGETRNANIILVGNFSKTSTWTTKKTMG
jgi:hypothetical protein